MSTEIPIDHYALRRCPEGFGVAVIAPCATPQRVFPSVPRQGSSSLGDMGVLPVEILHQCLGDLDLMSLSSFARVSLRGMTVVDSIPSFSILKEVCGDLFSILDAAQVLKHHSISVLLEALRTERCVSCNAYGPFLFILSARRCCMACLTQNQSLWMIPLDEVKECFQLTDKHLSSLPTMWSIPSRYIGDNDHTYPVELTSVGAAKLLALEVHKLPPATDMARYLDHRRLSPREPEPGIWRWYHRAPLHSILQDPGSTTSEEFAEYDDHFIGLTAAHCPSLVDGRIQHFYWCRVCEAKEIKDREHMMDSSALRVWTDTLTEECDEFDRYKRVRCCAWSKADFALHLKACHLPPSPRH
nr:hypothetical protein CFP56_75518 [Quercus suber]